MNCSFCQQECVLLYPGSNITNWESCKSCQVDFFFNPGTKRLSFHRFQRKINKRWYTLSFSYFDPTETMLTYWAFPVAGAISDLILLQTPCLVPNITPDNVINKITTMITFS
jgi:hypothetical protein